MNTLKQQGVGRSVEHRAGWGSMTSATSEERGETDPDLCVGLPDRSKRTGKRTKACLHVTEQQECCPNLPCAL